MPNPSTDPQTRPSHPNEHLHTCTEASCGLTVFWTLTPPYERASRNQNQKMGSDHTPNATKPYGSTNQIQVRQEQNVNSAPINTVCMLAKFQYCYAHHLAEEGPLPKPVQGFAV